MANIQYCYEPEQDCEYLPSPEECRASAIPKEASQKEIDEWINQADTKWYPSLKERFLHHAEDWQRATEHLSSPSQMMMHPSYQAVMGMSHENKDQIVRLMLVDLRDNRRLWFWALSFLTQENPVKSSEAGRLDAMIRAWVKWGTSKGII